jgi:hypothetical protein
MLETPVTEEASTAVGKAAETPCPQKGLQGSVRGNIGKNTSTAGLTAEQETTGTPGDANNSRMLTTIGRNSRNSREVNSKRTT